jgi:hypothetical protein
MHVLQVRGRASKDVDDRDDLLHAQREVVGHVHLRATSTARHDVKLGCRTDSDGDGDGGDATFAFTSFVLRFMGGRPTMAAAAGISRRAGNDTAVRSTPKYSLNGTFFH